MQRFPSVYGEISLTDERIQHILTFHPDMDGHIEHIAQALAEPETMVRSASDPSVVIFYRLIPKGKKYLAVAIKTSVRPFVLTAYLAKKPKRGTL